MTENKFSSEIIYHIYTFGMGNCLFHNDYSSEASNKLKILESELPKIKKLGFTAIILGPNFESIFHGYDTIDYFHVDRRIGNNEMMKHFCKEAHNLEIKIIFDVVFNHTGRLFPAFKDIKLNGIKSKFLKWYKNIDFSKNSEFNDEFDYEGWQGSKDLIKLDLSNHEVKKYFLSAIKFWITYFEIDGFRIDAAHLIDLKFLKEISTYSRSLKKNIWLLGEVIHENYSDFINKSKLDSCTDYQLYPAFYECFNKRDLTILSKELNKQFGKNGQYKNNSLYLFCDNHDVNRIASNLENPIFLIPLYIILFSLPGIPSVYYGSEFGIRGTRTEIFDEYIRPAIPPFCNQIPKWVYPEINSVFLLKTIKRMIQIRKKSMAILKGKFNLLKTSPNFLCFERVYKNEKVILGLNIGKKSEFLNLKLTNIYNLFTDKLETVYGGNFEFNKDEIYLISNYKIGEKNEI